jgi:hypothetical protein
MVERAQQLSIGARVVGVDIADNQVDLARQKAKDAGIDARFLTADVLHLPAEVPAGATSMSSTPATASFRGCPILNRGQVASIAPWRLILWETHPLLPCLRKEDGCLRVEGDYFGREQVELSRGWRHFPGAAATEAVKAQFTWPLGDVVSALAQTGLRIERLLEYPHRDHHRFPPPVVLPGLPSKYLLVARNA